VSSWSIEALVVVVPVHDEAVLLDSCLSSLGAAIARAPVPCEVRVVLDACTDGSAVIAARHPFAVVRTDAAAVGAARAQGIASGLTALRDVPAERVWIANTDADSTVPLTWITSQLELAASGADLVVGTVRPDFDDLSPAHQRLWLDTHTRGAPNGHTHGANLGVRASVYAAVGGFSALTEHEDVRLVDACRRIGATVIASDAAEVITSGRFIGRTPGGYAGHLRDQDRSLPVETTDLISQGDGR
jgi:hypothetical protein